MNNPITVSDSEGTKVQFQCPNCAGQLYPRQVELLATYTHAIKTMELRVSPSRFVAHIELECNTCRYNDERDKSAGC